MDITTLPLVGTLLRAAADLVTVLTDVLSPAAGPLAAGLAVVVVTLAVRLALVPLSLLQVRAERDRRRIAPLVAALRARCGRDTDRFRRELQVLMTAEGVTPLAGCLPVLAQAPVVSLLYALFTHATVDGTVNTLLRATLAGIPLGQSAVAVVTSPLWVHAWVVVVLLMLLTVVIELSRRANDRWRPADSPAGDAPGATIAVVVRRAAPFVTVAFAALAPLAAALYVVTSAVWSWGERAVLRRMIGV